MLTAWQDFERHDERMEALEEESLSFAVKIILALAIAAALVYLLMN